ncbi:MAG TPA: hypothetical protein VF576_03305 [Rubricoccaceae bacterium]|jgi:hypothetical protein
MSASLQALCAYLSGLAPGPIDAPSATLVPLLVHAWDDLRGSDAESTTASKLHRIEGAAWSPPHLTFRIERHGATVNGSGRADLHDWTVEVDAGTATCRTGRRRQLSPASRRLDVAPLVDEVLRAVGEGTEHEYVEWQGPDRLTVRIGKVVPDTGHQQTVTGRRKRFRTSLEPRLIASGWRPVTGTRANTYEREPAT